MGFVEETRQVLQDFLAPELCPERLQDADFIGNAVNARVSRFIALHHGMLPVRPHYSVQGHVFMQRVSGCLAVGVFPQDVDGL